MGNLPSFYSQFIHLSRYARWIEAEGRRENWEETVDRFLNYMCDVKCKGKIDNATRKELREVVICLEVMPSMRCIMTAGPALERDEAAAYNCFHGSERFYTEDGIKTLAETSGTVQKVITRDGRWGMAEIKSFGKQPLQLVTFKPGASPNARTNVRHAVRVTPDHRWLTENRGEVTDLRVGDIVGFRSLGAYEFNLEAWIRGFGFGDGTIDARGCAKVRLCGEKDMKWISKFEGYGHCCVMYPPSYNGDAVILFRRGHFSDWKELPKNTDPSYLASWLEGYIAADGHRDEHQPGLSSQNDEAIRFAMEVAPLAGYLVTGHNVSTVMETNFGPRSYPLQRLTLRKEGIFRVQSIDELEEDEVFCAVEPETHSFTLVNGILTGNCSYVAVDHPHAFDETLYLLMCFHPDTEVKVKGGVKKISEITPEDEVLSFNEGTGEYEYRKPSRVFRNPTENRPKIKLTFEDGSEETCTEDHLFYTKNRGWVKAIDLSEEDDL